MDSCSTYIKRSTAREADALRAFGGRGAVSLLAFDAASGEIVMQRAEPGYPLAELCETDDERATSIAAGVMRLLHRPVPDGFTFLTTDSWRADLQRLAEELGLKPLVQSLASDARAIAAELSASSSESVLLHGDLHQFNILAHGDQWVAIDPVGIVGERACEIAPLVLNPIALLSRTLVSRRIDQLCDELALDRRRAHAWTFVRTVLAILWSFEDDGEAPAEWMACAQWLR